MHRAGAYTHAHIYTHGPHAERRHETARAPRERVALSNRRGERGVCAPRSRERGRISDA